MALKHAALAALVAGLGLLAYGAWNGDVRVGLLLFIPFVFATGIAPALGMLLVIAALVMWTLSRMPRDVPGPDGGAGLAPEADPREREAGQRTSRSGGVVLLGPIPIVWGSDRRILPWMVAAGGVLLALGIFLAMR